MLSFGHHERTDPPRTRVPHCRHRPAQGAQGRPASAPASRGRKWQRHQCGRIRGGERRHGGGDDEGRPRGRRHAGVRPRHAAPAGVQRSSLQGQRAQGAHRLHPRPDARDVPRPRGREVGEGRCAVQGRGQGRRRAHVRSAEEVRDGRLGAGAGGQEAAARQRGRRPSPARCLRRGPEAQRTAGTRDRETGHLLSRSPSLCRGRGCSVHAG